MERSRLTVEEKKDLALIKMIKRVVIEDKNTDVKITAGRGDTIKVIKQKNSNLF